MEKAPGRNRPLGHGGGLPYAHKSTVVNIYCTGHQALELESTGLGFAVRWLLSVPAAWCCTSKTDSAQTILLAVTLSKKLQIKLSN